jgi:hypothetical protein
MIPTNNTSIGEIVANNFKTAAVFSKHDIDFCCKGQRSISEVCRKNNINPDSLLHELNEVMNIADEKAQLLEGLISITKILRRKKADSIVELKTNTDLKIKNNRSKKSSKITFNLEKGNEQIQLINSFQFEFHFAENPPKKVKVNGKRTLIEINVNKKYFSLPLSIQGNTTNVKIKW